jgi:hypothetical protein
MRDSVRAHFAGIAWQMPADVALVRQVIDFQCSTT